MKSIPAIVALACLPLAAQPAVVVTPGNLADRVRSQNPDLAAARLRIQEAIGRMTQSGRLDNPALDVGFEHNARFREGRFEVGFSQRFPVTDRLRLEKQITRTAIEAAEAEVRDIERQLAARAGTTLVKILATRLRRELLREQSEVAREFAEFLAGIAAKGEGSPLDAGQARIEAASLATELRLLDAAETALAGELKPLLGMAPGEPLQVSGTLAPPGHVARGVDPARRPDFQAAVFEAQAARDAVSLEQARRYEDVEAGVFAAAERFEDAPEGFQNEAIVGLRLRIALPFWNHNEGAIQEAEARHQRKQLEADALARNIGLEAEAARAEMDEWRRLIAEIDDTLLPLANDQTTLAETTYRNGQGDIQSVLRAREKHLQLAATKLDALREYHLARIRHDAAVGK
jgi:cobalt-zinc-cadmium efflux system outer membrane protein